MHGRKKAAGGGVATQLDGKDRDGVDGDGWGERHSSDRMEGIGVCGGDISDVCSRLTPSPLDLSAGAQGGQARHQHLRWRVW